MRIWDLWNLVPSGFGMCGTWSQVDSGLVRLCPTWLQDEVDSGRMGLGPGPLGPGLNEGGTWGGTCSQVELGPVAPGPSECGTWSQMDLGPVSSGLGTCETCSEVDRGLVGPGFGTCVTRLNSGSLGCPMTIWDFLDLVPNGYVTWSRVDMGPVGPDS
jgi:hypothetical protein